MYNCCDMLPARRLATSTATLANHCILHRLRHLAATPAACHLTADREYRDNSQVADIFLTRCRALAP